MTSRPMKLYAKRSARHEALAERSCEDAATWTVKPAMAAGERGARANQWTRDGKLRAPVFLGLRDDKDPRTVTKES